MLRSKLNAAFDKLARPEVSVLGASFPAYSVFLYAGVCLAIIFMLLSASALGLPIFATILIVSGSILAVLGWTTIPQLVSADPTLCFYQYLISIVLIAALVPWMLGISLLPYLDVTVLAVGLGHSVAKSGCLRAGCCYGKPCAWGILYSRLDYAKYHGSSIPEVRLFPVQLLESMGVFSLVVLGVGLLLRSGPTGLVTGWYVAGYAVLRFFLDFARAQPAIAAAGLSGSQWVSVSLLSCVCALEICERLPPTPWHLAAGGLLLTATLIVLAVNRVSTERNSRQAAWLRSSHT